MTYIRKAKQTGSTTGTMLRQRQQLRVWTSVTPPVPGAGEAVAGGFNQCDTAALASADAGVAWGACGSEDPSSQTVSPPLCAATPDEVNVRRMSHAHLELRQQRLHCANAKHRSRAQ